MRFRFGVQIAGLVLLSILTILVIDLYDLGAWFQSPFSPVQPGDVPTAAPVLTAPGIAISPLVLPRERLTDLFDAPVWASPWPWMAVGVVFFGGLAFGLIQLLHRAGLTGR
jgi:hypothetical protein